MRKIGTPSTSPRALNCPAWTFEEIMIIIIIIHYYKVIRNGTLIPINWTLRVCICLDTTLYTVVHFQMCLKTGYSKCTILDTSRTLVNKDMHNMGTFSFLAVLLGYGPFFIEPLVAISWIRSRAQTLTAVY